MEMAANVRRMRVICSPEREEDVAAAHEPLQPPLKAGVPAVPAVPTTAAMGCSPGDRPPAPGCPALPHQGRIHIHAAQCLPNLPGGASLAWAPIPKEFHVGASLLPKISPMPTLWRWQCCLHRICHGRAFRICSALLPEPSFP